MGRAFKIVSEKGPLQNSKQDSFSGGRPILPPDLALPVCGLCHATQTFFFQVALPNSHAWAGRTVAVFACTSCADENFLIPELIDGERAGIDVPIEFMERPRLNYALLTFSSFATELRETYIPKLEFRRWRLRETYLEYPGSKVCGQPSWITENEAPRSCNGTYEMVFLLQIAAGMKFSKLPDAPPQMEFSYLSGMKGQPSKQPYYELFLGNALYLFGTMGLSNDLIYPIVQKWI